MCCFHSAANVFAFFLGVRYSVRTLVQLIRATRDSSGVCMQCKTLSTKDSHCISHRLTSVSLSAFEEAAVGMAHFHF